MPNELETTVQKMIDAGEPEENIATVIQEYTGRSVPKAISANEPSTFAGGVMKSLNPLGLLTGNGGEAAGASARGGLGFLQGSIADLPSSIGGALKTVGGMVTSPRETSKELWEGAKQLPSQIAETTRMAGSKPQEFGRMVGQFTGQPLATEGLGIGLAKATPPVVRGLGKAASAISDTAAKQGLVSGVLPYGVARWAVPAYLRSADKALGRGLGNLGEMMQGVGLPKPAGPSFRVAPTPEPFNPEITDLGNVPTQRQLMPPQPLALPEPRHRFEGTQGGFSTPESSLITGFPNEGATQVPSNIFDLENPNQILDESGRSIAPQPTAQPRPAGPWDSNTANPTTPTNPPNTPMPQTPFQTNEDAYWRAKLGLEPKTPTTPIKSKVKLNTDGTYTNLETGEVLDSQGKSVEIPPTTTQSRTPISHPKTQLELIQQALAKGEINNEVADALIKQNTERLTKEAADLKSHGFTQQPMTPESFGSNFWERSLTAPSKALTPEVLEPSPYEFGDIDNPDFGRMKQVESTRNANPQWRRNMKEQWGEMSEGEINKFLKLKSAMNGPLKEITPAMHQEFVELGKKIPGGYNQPDQYLLKQQAEQTRLQNIAKQKRGLPSANSEALTRGAESLSGSPAGAPMGMNIKLKLQFTTPDIVKQLKTSGFDFTGLTEKGEMKFTKVR